MSSRLPLLPTTVVGSYPQPDWLIDRAKLGSKVPRIRMPEIWRVAPERLAEAQDEATRLAVRDMEQAGIDIVTDGEMRRESYSNRFATALDGVDIESPATIVNRVGGQDELVFDGASFVLNADRSLAAQAPSFAEAVRVTRWSPVRSRRSLMCSGSDEALTSKRRCTAFDTLFTFWPPAPCARTAVISISCSGIRMFIRIRGQGHD